MLKTVFTTIEEAEQFLDTFASKEHTRPRTLDRIQLLMQSIGNPQQTLTVIHVTGSSGKGSTAYMTATLLEKAGYTVGLHMKPHLQSITERISINRTPISKKDFLFYFNKLYPIAQTIIQKDNENKPTYFELLVAITLWYFHDHHVDIVVMEVGRGGRVDATHICQSKLLILTNVALLHRGVLGNTIKQITKEKLQIASEKTPVITHITQKPLQLFVKTYCSTHHLPLTIISNTISVITSPIQQYGLNATPRTLTYINNNTHINRIPFPLYGVFQEKNAALAITAAKTIAPFITDEQIRNAFSSMKLPGRMEIVSYNNNILVMDCAHKPTKLTDLRNTLTKLFPQTSLCVVIPLLYQERTANIVKTLLPIVKECVCISYKEREAKLTDSFRYQQILQKAKRTGGITHMTIAQFKKHVSSSKNEIFLITGSISLIEKVRSSIQIPFTLK